MKRTRPSERSSNSRSRKTRAATRLNFELDCFGAVLLCDTLFVAPLTPRQDYIKSVPESESESLESTTKATSQFSERRESQESAVNGPDFPVLGRDKRR